MLKGALFLWYEISWFTFAWMMMAPLSMRDLEKLLNTLFGRIIRFWMRRSGTCQQVRDTRVENLSSRRRLSWRVDPHLVRRSGDSSLWVDEPLGMPGAGLIENMLAPLDDSVGLAMMNHGRR